MQDLLDQDTGKVSAQPILDISLLILQILNIRLFVLGHFISSKTSRGEHIQIGERIDVTYDAMNVATLLDSELGCRKGQTLVSSKCSYMLTKVGALRLHSMYK